MRTPEATLRDRLSGLTLRDERRLARRLDRVRARDGGGAAAELERLADEITAAEGLVARRRLAVPAVAYPPSLPISARVADVAAALRDHQVVVVAGETGSGKTTQLPKVCLELGRGVRGRIGHTQPRRLAARTVADRIADELGVEVGGVVGYEVRFDQRTSEDTLVSLLTDGMLLAQVPSDPLLRAYDTIIVDEAHERSLNIDFLVGYLTQLLPHRRDLKIVVTSATIDPQRFSRHFGGAPVVEVSGRTYPVEVRYRPLDPSEAASGDDADEELEAAAPGGERDQPQAICDAIRELVDEGPGDILVFLSGEREIRDAAEAVAELGLPDTEVLPLYARLSTAQQRRVFAPHPGRRVVLATNVAETSLTVPGVRYVVDTGLARISRYSTRLKVQRLPIEKVSQASADQRAGRCGRVADGICIRLYGEQDYATRSRFTDPEILRTGLAAVLLQMAALGLGEVADFPFLDPPDTRQVRDGLQLLHELQAVEVPDEPRTRSGRRGRHRPPRGPRLTPVGRTLSRLPVDPRLARMLVEADRTGCLDEVVVIVAALSIPDPRLRPPDQQQSADALHARFAADDSDFLTLVNLWRYLREQRRARSSSSFRRMCRDEHLHALRVREWQDLVVQLRRVTRDLGMHANTSPAEADAVHAAMLAGLLSQIGMRDGERREYRGARGARFAIQPGSVLFRRSPRWVMAAELVETSRLWARTVARIRPEWVERLGAHLLVRSYAEPRWDAERGGSVADESVTLYGVPLAAGRTVAYGAVDPAHARELFIRHALVDGEWRTSHAFWQRNAVRLAEAEALEDKLRRRDVVVDDDALFAFYDARIPDGIVSVRHFDRWWQEVRRDEPERLDLSDSVLYGDDPARAQRAGLPDRWQQADVALPLSYRFDPGSESDGVTVHVPLPLLNRVDPEGFDWQVPGLRRELLVELLRSLPKDVRRRLVPIPDTAAALLSRVGPSDGPLLAVLEGELRRRMAVDVGPDDWDLDRLPGHLRMTFRVEDGEGRVVDEGRDVAELQRRLAPRVEATLTAAAGIERGGLRSWTIGTLSRRFDAERGGRRVVGYPALVDEGDAVAVRVLATQADQRRAMWAGTRRLLLLAAGSPLAQVNRRLDRATKLALTANPHGSVPDLLDDATRCALDELMLRAGGPVWDADAFAELLTAVRAGLVDAVVEVLGHAGRIIPVAADVRTRLSQLDLPVLQPAVADLQTQLAGLVHHGFLASKSARRLPDVVRYVDAARRRLDTLVRDPARDRARMARIHEVQDAHRSLLARLPPERRSRPAVRELPWMIEELRVSEFAQQLGTAYRVSPERVLRAIDDAGR